MYNFMCVFLCQQPLPLCHTLLITNIVPSTTSMLGLGVNIISCFQLLQHWSLCEWLILLSATLAICVTFNHCNSGSLCEWIILPFPQWSSESTSSLAFNFCHYSHLYEFLVVPSTIIIIVLCLWMDVIPLGKGEWVIFLRF